MKNNYSVNAFFSKTASNITTVFPLLLSMCVCSGLSSFAGILISCIFALFYKPGFNCKNTNIFLVFLILNYCLLANGLFTAITAFAVCLVLTVILKIFKFNIQTSSDSPTSPAFMLATALTITVLFTTHYFGIGASGNNVSEMIASYLSLGFHPNWRGVLYGTIAMVIMITFPRKFKKLNGIISAPFLAIIITTLLNFCLNPSYMISSITEIGYPSFIQFKSSILSADNSFSVINAILSAFAMFFALISTTQNINVQNEKISFADIAPNITSAVLIAIIGLLGKSFIARIPLHSCAVIMIVGVWQSVEWSKFKSVFLNFYSFISFAAVIISILLLGVIYGVLIAAYISTLYTIFNTKKFKL